MVEFIVIFREFQNVKRSASLLVDFFITTNLPQWVENSYYSLAQQNIGDAVSETLEHLWKWNEYEFQVREKEFEYDWKFPNNSCASTLTLKNANRRRTRRGCPAVEENTTQQWSKWTRDENEKFPWDRFVVESPSYLSTPHHRERYSSLVDLRSVKHPARLTSRELRMEIIETIKRTRSTVICHRHSTSVWDLIVLSNKII